MTVACIISMFLVKLSFIFFDGAFEQTDRQSSGSNLERSNWQKVQLNTDLLKQGHRYLYRNDIIIKTKWNWEVIKNGRIFNTGGLFNQGMSEAKRWMEKEGAAREVLRQFL